MMFIQKNNLHSMREEVAAMLYRLKEEIE